ncbi:MAG: Rieske 2Fe-2S domain-containing protein [Flavobacteriales bacterium]|nr:Rieske 2Fe-2S domain-containing protein [Flavobacteriales bacterium]MCB9448932.1 Rieske 2Fe-2S domain-containing protein [Flavobacteriales bacterium]
MDRKTFIRNTGCACVGLMAGSAVVSLLQGCAAIPVCKAVVEEGKICVPLSEWPAEEHTRIVRAPQLEYDLLVVRKADGSYRALEMKCTHADNRLSANPKGLVCTLHGSTFGLEGEVTNGPAIAPLKTFPVYQEQNNLYIQVKS